MSSQRLSEQEYRTLGDILRKAVEDRQFETTAEIIRVVALAGCRRSEVIGLRWGEVDIEASCLRLIDGKDAASIEATAGAPRSPSRWRVDPNPLSAGAACACS